MEDRICPVCGRDHRECDANLLGGMYLNAREQARKALSPQGMETLKMIESAAETLGAGEAYLQAKATAYLTEEEHTAIEVFLARLTLIEQTEKDIGVYVSEEDAARSRGEEAWE